VKRSILLAVLAAAVLSARAQAEPAVLKSENFRHYIEHFNRLFPEEVVNLIPDARAWDFLRQNIPLFACPDRNIEEIYYYRWWAYRKHIKQTPKGIIVTEFLKPVAHAAEYNAISCAFGHHVAEGRWLRDPKYLDEYAAFWLRSGPGGSLHSRFHQFSGWAAAALYERYLADGRQDSLVAYLDALILDYRIWECDRLLPSGLFWQTDVADGMEESASGGRHVKNARPTINSYMFGNARAIAAIAALAHKSAASTEFAAKAAKLKQLVQERLWNPRDAFFETQLEDGKPAGVREEIGFTPWLFDLPDRGKRYESAWKQLMDTGGFYAPYGPATTERRSSLFRIADTGDDCQWNGPSWPFATAITLKALANVLNDYSQNYVSKDDYFKTFQTYTRSQHLKRADGEVVPFIDEDLDPLTGEWQARKRKLQKGTFYGRGDHYNHSTYADLVITDLAGLRPRADNLIEVHPLVPDETWDWFCLDNVPYHGHTVTIVWDKTGAHFHKGKGLRVFVDGHEAAHGPSLATVKGRI
jgi:hypothetical protein